MCSPPPECGPAAVAKVPLTTSASPAATKTSASRRNSGGTTGGDRPSRSPNASTVTTTAPARSANDRSRCVITTGQRRSVATARYPIGACASAPTKTSNAIRRAQAGSPGARRAASHVTRVSVITTPPTSRFPNSTKAWMSFSGSGRPRSHPGQARQPSPESVSRTAAPLPTISQRSSVFARATWTSRAGDTSKVRILARAVVSIYVSGSRSSG